jgi:hypothetical protein
MADLTLQERELYELFREAVDNAAMSSAVVRCAHMLPPGDSEVASEVQSLAEVAAERAARLRARMLELVRRADTADSARPASG